MRDEELLKQLTADRRALHRIPETDAALPAAAACGAAVRGVFAVGERGLRVV